MNLNSGEKYSQEILYSVEEFSFEKIKDVYFKHEDMTYRYNFNWLKRKYENIFYKEYSSLIAFINDLNYNHKLYDMAKLEQEISKTPYIYDYLDENGRQIYAMDAKSIEINYTIKNNN